MTENSSGPAGPTSPSKIDIAIDCNATLEELDALLSTGYDDPVKSRLLEAARAQILTQGDVGISPHLPHLDGHIDWHPHIDF